LSQPQLIVVGIGEETPEVHVGRGAAALAKLSDLGVR
jgi:hypothetical protein